MFAALATLSFLAILWLIGVVLARMLSDSGGKVMAALKGRSVLASSPVTAQMTARVSLRARPQRAMRVQPQWRAAA